MRRMTPEQFKKKREKLGTQAEVGEELDLTSRTLYNHENSQNPYIPRWLQYAIQYLSK